MDVKYSNYLAKSAGSKGFRSFSRRPTWQTLTLRATLPLLALTALTLPITLLFMYGFTIIYPDHGITCSTIRFSKESLLAPDTLFGNFTIAEARMIDLTWNLAAGRGLQAGMAVLTYKAANAGLLRIAEAVPVSYRTFESVSIRQMSFSAIGPLTRAVWKTSHWRAKVTFAFLLLSAIFILFLLTMSDIMTGYVQNSNLNCQLFNGTMVAASEIESFHFRRDASSCMGIREDGSDGPVIGRLVCVSDTGYQWGCSAIWLIIISCLTSFWAFGTYGIWVDADRFSVLRRNGRKLGTWRAITDLAKAIEQDAGSILDEYSNEELEKEVDTAPPVMYTVKLKYGGLLDKVVLSSRSKAL
jgi:hypothetical protein